MERHIACVLGIPQRGADLRPEMMQGLASEAREEAQEILRKMKAKGLRPTKLVKDVKELLAPYAENESASEAVESTTDWVKVLSKNEAGGF